MINNKNRLLKLLSKKWDYIVVLILLSVYIIITLCIKTTIWTNVYECNEGVCIQTAVVPVFYLLFVRSPFFVPIIFLFLNIAVAIIGLVYNKFQLFLRILNFSLFVINIIFLILSII